MKPKKKQEQQQHLNKLLQLELQQRIQQLKELKK